MKKLFIFGIVMAFFSCESPQPADYAILSGSIQNAAKNKITLYNMYDRNDKMDITLNDDGTFTDTISLEWNQAYSFAQNRNRMNLFLSKGDNLTIEYDATKMDSTLVLSGVGNEVNQYLVEKTKIDKGVDLVKMFSKEEEEFKKELVDTKEKKLALLNSKTTLDKEFAEREKNNIKYEYLGNVNNYELYHGFYTQNRAFVASEEFKSELDSLTFDKVEDFKFSPSYRGIINSHIRNKVMKSKDTITSFYVQSLNAYAVIENQFIKNKLLFDEAQLAITIDEDLEKYYQTFIAASTNKENNEIITKTYNALKLLGKGNSSPQFTNYENYAGGTSSLSDFKGKYVYIDVWATWCGPCIREIPSLKKVEKKYHDKNIEFVSISIDKKTDHEKWKKMIADRELGGTQLFADADWQSQFIEDYMIKGIPRFILIDPSGNIVNFNAPRPSSSDLTQLFDELLL